ncbi:hypothetical protein ACFC1D_03405 [Streptomyces vinaceus]|uniref:hypothetical protein n=1 Tax=Streptomyces vinaceus TaxID=1960 RepID=UPI0035D7AED1
MNEDAFWQLNEDCRPPECDPDAELLAALSDDAFLCTCAAVVAAGRTEFDSVLQDPTAFTPYATDLIWAERLLHTPDRAYKRITGEEWDRDTRYP